MSKVLARAIDDDKKNVLLNAFREIEQHRRAIESADTAARLKLDDVHDQLRGLRIRCSMAGGGPGEYEIMRASVTYGRINARGCKVLAGGKLGSQHWDLGDISSAHLLAVHGGEQSS